MLCLGPICGMTFAGYEGEANTSNAFVEAILDERVPLRFLAELAVVPIVGNLTPSEGNPIMAFPFCSIDGEEAASQITERRFYGDGRWVGTPFDLQRPNDAADVRLEVPADVDISLPLYPEQSRRAQVQIGSVKISNADGALDDLLARYAIDGRPVQIRLGPAEGAFADFRVIANAYGDTLEGDRQTVTLQLTNVTFYLDVPLQTGPYSGTGGLEGDAEIEGRARPQAYGDLFNVTPVLINKDLYVYQLHDRQIHAIDAVKDQGVPLDDSGDDYANISLLRLATIAPGEYATCKAFGLVRAAFAGGTPAGTVTVDLRGDATETGYVDQTGDILLRLARTRAVVPASRIDFSGLNSLNSTGVIGWYADGSDVVTVGDAFDQLCQPLNAWYGSTPSGRLTAGRLPVPEDVSPTTSFEEVHFSSLRQDPVTVSPRYRQGVRYRKNWTVMSDDAVSDLVSADDRLALTTSGPIAQARSSSVRLRHATAIDAGDLEAWFVDEADAQAAANHIIRLYREPRRVLRGTVGRKGILTPVRTVVGVDHRRFELDGQSFVVMRQRLSAQNRKLEVQLELWG